MRRSQTPPIPALYWIRAKPPKAQQLFHFDCRGLRQYNTSRFSYPGPAKRYHHRGLGKVEEETK